MEKPSSPSPEANQGGSLRGRFSEATDEFVQVFTASIDFDRRLYKEDIAGSIAHATMLETIGVLSQTEKDQILLGLNTVLAEIDNGDMRWRVDLEDVHMNIEHRLIELLVIPARSFIRDDLATIKLQQISASTCGQP